MRKLGFGLGYGLGYALYTVYSYSQVEPNLVLSTNPLFWSFQQVMWRFGGEQTFWSMGVFVVLIGWLFGGYLVALHQFQQGRWGLRELKWLFAGAVIALWFSFPALSNDVFNYLFNGKMQVVYGANPAITAPWEFPQDPWLRFMHNVHVTSPYGPVWRLIEAGAYRMSWGYLKGGLVVYRGFMTLAVTFIGWVIYRLRREEKVYATAWFLLNPLILLEGVGSLHNDVVMMAIFMGSVLVASGIQHKQERWWYGLTAGILWILSVLTKLVTVISVIVYPIFWGLHKLVKYGDYYAMLIIAFIGLLFWDGSQRFFSWYLIWPITLGPLTRVNGLRQGLVWFSLSGLLSYSVYLYLKDYTPDSYRIRLLIYFGIPLVYVVSMVVRKRFPGKIRV